MGRRRKWDVFSVTIKKGRRKNMSAGVSSPAREYCRVPKLFRTYSSSELKVRNMKLNKRKIHWIIREKKNISRPKKPYDSKEVQIVILAYTCHRLGTDALGSDKEDL